MKALLKSFHLNGHTLEFCLYTPKLKLHTKQIVPSESAAKEVSFERNTTGFHPQTQKLELHNK